MCEGIAGETSSAVAAAKRAMGSPLTASTLQPLRAGTARQAMNRFDVAAGGAGGS